MNIQKFTQKSMQAIQDCEKLAYEYGNQEIEQEHLLVALMRQEDGLIPMLIEKMEINKQHFMNNAEDHLAKRVKVSGGQVYVGQQLNKVLISAEDEAKQMGDEYVSVEHLFLSMIRYPNPAIKEIFREYGITRDRFLQVLSTVRGNQRVVSDNPGDKAVIFCFRPKFQLISIRFSHLFYFLTWIFLQIVNFLCMIKQCI